MSNKQPDKPTILIVEDNPETLGLLFDHLREAGFETLVARNGEGALQQVEFAQPDLILLDVMLPGIDGFETCRRLKYKETAKDIPVIFMTALSDTVDKVKGFEAGGVDYLTKPFQSEEVLARVNAQLTIRKFQQQLQKQNVLLEEQNARFQQLSEATFEGIVIHDKGDIVEVNQALEKMFGYQRSELIGRNALEFVAPASHDIVQHHISTGDEHPYEAKAVRKNGESFPVEVQAKTMPYQGRDVRITAIRDLSWRKAMEEEKVRLEKENLNLKTTVKDRYKFGEIIGKSPLMQDIYELIAHTAATDANVVISGETGTGKELIAHTIHQLSDRGKHAFVPINCGAIPEALFEREFFGHRKGAFTGADQDKAGYFDLAHQGTLFLDEIGELSPILQVKLLRAVENGEYIPLGTNTSKTVDVRIVAATNRDLEEQVQQGTMRDDFFFRLNVILIAIPPLRDRKEDLPLLIDHFLDQHSKGASRPRLPGHVLQRLYHHDWSGNIRELQNVLQRYLTVNRLEFPGSTRSISGAGHEGCANLEIAVANQTLQEILEAFEKQVLLKALEQHRWHKVKTAQTLGIGRKTLYRKMKQFGLMSFQGVTCLEKMSP